MKVILTYITLSLVLLLAIGWMFKAEKHSFPLQPKLQVSN